MSSRKPQSMSALNGDSTSTSSLTSGTDTAPRRNRSHRGDSSHSRTSLGSLDDIHELEDPSLARARDRIRRSGTNPPVSSSSLSRSKRHSNEDTPTPTTTTSSENTFSAADETASRRGSRRRVPRATQSNDSLGVMSASVSTFQNDSGSSRSIQRSRRAPPARSKSTDDSFSLIPLATTGTTRTPRNSDTTTTRNSDTTTTTTTSNSNNNSTRATDATPTEDRGRSATSNKQRSSSRSRSKSRGARKRPNARAAQVVASANSSVTSKRDSTESNNKELSSVTTSTSVRTRRKLGGGGEGKNNNNNSSLSGLSMLDDLAPRIGPRDAKSVGVELLSPPSRPKLPQRKLDRGLGDSGISSLAAFLNNKSPKSNNKLSSSRSVGAMPTTNTITGSGSSSVSSKKPLRRRLKKNDDESLASSATSKQQQQLQQQQQLRSSSTKNKFKGHSSLGSGLDLHTASNAPMESYDASNNKMRGRKTKSKASSDESLQDEGSLHVSDILGNNKSGGTTNTRSSSRSRSESTTTRSMQRLNQSMGDIALKVSDLGSLLAEQKELKRRTGSASVVSDLVVKDEQQQQQQPQDDIFSMYAWTTSRQESHKIQQERQILNSTLRQGAFQKAFELYVGQSTTTTT